MSQATDTPTTSRRRLFGGVAALAAAPAVAAAASAPAPDAVLLLLGEQFDAANAVEQAAWAAAETAELDDDPRFVWADECAERTSAIVAQIEAVRATTVAGLIVKTKAIRWCRSGEPAGLEIFGYYPWKANHPATDERLIVSLMADLYALAGRGTGA